MDDIEKEFIDAYENNADQIFGYCLIKVSDREKAKDLLQDTFMRLWNFMRKGKKVEKHRVFIYRIASNLIIDHYRKKKESSLDAMIESSGNEPVDSEEMGVKIKYRIDGEIVIRLLEEIPNIYKDVIYMHYIDDLSISEISDIVGESANNVSVRLHRGISKLKKIYYDYEKR